MGDYATIVVIAAAIPAGINQRHSKDLLPRVTYRRNGTFFGGGCGKIDSPCFILIFLFVDEIETTRKTVDVFQLDEIRHQLGIFRFDLVFAVFVQPFYVRCEIELTICEQQCA